MNKLLLLYLSFLPLFCFSQPQEATLLGHWSDDDNLPVVGWLQSRYNEVWGVAINDAEIGIIGSTMGTHFINVTNPNDIYQIQMVEGMTANASVVHRDYHDHDGYLYAVADEGTASGLEIFDLSGLPNSVERVYASSDLITRSHNIFIDEDNDRLYAVSGNGASTGPFSFLVLDISEPINPQVLAVYNNTQLFPNNHDAYVRDNIAYINNGGGGLAIVDMTNPTAPELLGSIDNYPHDGYNHAGWLDEEGRYYYMLDETHNADVKVIDVCDKEDLEVVKLFDAEAQNETSIAHNAIVHCNRLYISYYYDGLQVYDLTDPSNPQRIYYYDTYPGDDDDFFAGAWGVYPLLPSGNILLSDLQTGLYVFEAIEDDCTYDNLADCDESNDNTNAVKNTTAIQDYSVFPQPASTHFNINIKMAENVKAAFSLKSVEGRNIVDFGERNLYQGEQAITFETDNLSAGLYFLQMKGEKTNKTFKIIIE